MSGLDTCVRGLERGCPPLGRWAARTVARIRHDRYWRSRTRLTMACPDNALIPRVRGAGKIKDGQQMMHNGIRVYYGSYSYFAEEMHELLRRNRGVHEPQEERVFAAVLPHVKPGGVIVELGACWAFYSLWFAKTVPQAQVYLLEGDAKCLANGQRNFELNGLTAHRTQGWVGGRDSRGPDGQPVLNLDDFVATHKIPRLAILHSDIQGAELEMLHGAEGLLRSGRIDYLFISTHSNEVHEACARLLRSHRYELVASANVSQSYAGDGVLVMKHPWMADPLPVAISRRKS